MEEGVPDGIEDIKSERNDAIEVARYNSDGIAINVPVRGLNIIKYSNGTVKKEYVK